MKAFFNKILRINLKTKRVKEESIPDSVYETYVGGRGFGTYLLKKENPSGERIPISPRTRS
jgi:aldehyde:ferredoxin oxidoreductase